MRPRLPRDRSVVPHAGSEGWLTGTVVAATAAICTWAGLFPQTFAPLAERLAAAYTFFLP
jgi:hypothetical protein